MDVENGASDPLPGYFGEWQLARWMGITRADLLDMPVHEVMEAQITMGAINQAERDAQKAQHKGGRKR